MSVKAKSLKDAGNTAFRQGRYEDAVLLYTEACQLDPSEYIYPLNRCMAYLKLDKLREAERDATKSLQLMPADNPKAFFRRGLARKGLGKLDLARQDFESALKEEPGNASMKAELDALPPLSTKSEEALASPSTSRPEKSRTKNQSLPVDTPESSNGLAPQRKTALKAAITPEKSQDSGGLLSAVSTRRLKEPAKPESSTNLPAASISTPEGAAPAPKDFKSLRAARNQRLKAPSPVPDVKISDKSEVQQTVGATISPEKAGVKVTAEKSPLPVSAAPKNMYDFENRWINNRDMQSRASMIVALVKQNTSLPAVFGSSLTPELLDEILGCLKSSCIEYPESRDAAVRFLQALPQCARFDFVSMLCANTSYVKDIVGSDARALEISQSWGA